jgi:hypothetical protein
MAFANIVVEVGLNGSAFERVVTNVIAKAHQMNAAFGKAVSNIAKNQISQAFAVAAVVNKMQAGISEAIAFGSSILNLSKELNVSTDVLQLWNYAARTTGATMGDVQQMFLHLARKSQDAANGTEETIAAFAKLGVTIDDVKNKKPEEIARLIGKAFENKDADATKLEGALRDVGGRGAHALISAFETGIGATFDEGLRLNIIIDADALEQIDALGNKLEALQIRMRPVFIGIATILYQVAEAIYDSVRLLIAGAMDLMGNLRDPSGVDNIKNPEVKQQVNARIQKNFLTNETKSAPEVIEILKAEKMAEIDTLLKKRQNDIDSVLKDAAEQGLSKDDPIVQAQMVGIDAKFQAERARLQAELKALTEAYVEPFSAVSTLVQEKIDQANAEAKALEEAARKRQEKKDKKPKPLVDESIPKKLRPVAREKQAELLPKITDSLAKFGGFTMGRDVLTLTVAKQQLEVLETISKNTDALKDFEPAGDGL